MKKECVVLMPVCLILLLLLGPSLPIFRDRLSYAQLAQDNTGLSQQQRLGTNNVLDPPGDVSVLYGNHQNASLDEQYILIGNNPGTYNNRHNVAVSNPDYGLSTPIPALTIGGNFSVNSSTDADIVYTSGTVTLVPITSPFPPPGISVEDVDPESDISLGTPITIGNYTGGLGTFTIPHTAAPGYYILYVYFKYPDYNVTSVFNTAVQLKGSSAG